ncbi:DUF1330 domain-containing protein [Comamonas sp.]|uniref:DUF1330 domain-containing protein n=1 Tax=Comamonas sp. TaxID=34028 RepID=UPI002899EB4E|nr:DUF1330 domain-containing protein [Comamonas sp.]
MTAYALFIREETIDQSELDLYASLVPASLNTHSPKILAAYGEQEVVEGPPCEGVVLVEFPTLELASAWYHSPEYQNAVQHRLKGARYRGILLAGSDN